MLQKGVLSEPNNVNGFSFKMETKEMITIQIGHFANYVGAHYWNIQA